MMVVTPSAWVLSQNAPHRTVKKQVQPMSYIMPTSSTATSRAVAIKNLRTEPQTLSETLCYILLAPIIFAITVVVAVAFS